MDQLLTLKNLADEQGQLNDYIKEQDQKFERLVDEIRMGQLDHYADKSEIVKVFGDPIYVRTVVKNGQELESWLYRYSTEFFGAEKVYLYFDRSGELVISEYLEGHDGKIR